jgi:hypothetical protein
MRAATRRRSQRCVIARLHPGQPSPRLPDTQKYPQKLGSLYCTIRDLVLYYEKRAVIRLTLVCSENRLPLSSVTTHNPQVMRRQNMAANTQNALADTDAQETQEWLDALSSVVSQEGTDRAHFLIEKLIEAGREEGIDIPYSANTQYINTIPADRSPATRATRTWRSSSTPTSAGTPWPWSCAPTSTPTSAATSPRSPPPPPSTTWASRTSGRASTTTPAAT